MIACSMWNVTKKIVIVYGLVGSIIMIKISMKVHKTNFVSRSVNSILR